MRLLRKLLFKTGLVLSRGNILVQSNGLHLSLKTRHYQLRRSLIDGWEPVMSKLVSLADKETTFLDIGANVGIASLLIAVLCGSKAFAFEPNLGTFCELNENIILNPGLNITPLNLALSSSHGFVPMTNLRSSAINRVLDRSASGADSVIAKEGFWLAPALSLDEFAMFYLDPETLTRVLIKIDVERHELDVLRGATEFLKSSVPIALCAEFYSADNLREIEEFVAGFSFLPLEVPKSSLLETSNANESYDVFFANSAWIAGG
jgi:FkbM family methyltransferase